VARDARLDSSRSPLQRFCGDLGTNHPLLLQHPFPGRCRQDDLVAKHFLDTPATGLVGEEGNIFRFTLWHSATMVLLMSVLTYLQAYVLKWMLP
jgi:hypothetical protein